MSKQEIEQDIHCKWNCKVAKFKLVEYIIKTFHLQKYARYNTNDNDQEHHLYKYCNASYTSSVEFYNINSKCRRNSQIVRGYCVTKSTFLP